MNTANNETSNANDVVSSLPARLEELAGTNIENLNIEDAVSVIEEAVGGLHTTDKNSAPIHNFNRTDLNNLATIILKFKRNPSVVIEDVYAALLHQAHTLIKSRREVLDQLEEKERDDHELPLLMHAQQNRIRSDVAGITTIGATFDNNSFNGVGNRKQKRA